MPYLKSEHRLVILTFMRSSSRGDDTRAIYSVMNPRGHSTRVGGSRHFASGIRTDVVRDRARRETSAAREIAGWYTLDASLYGCTYCTVAIDSTPPGIMIVEVPVRLLANAGDFSCMVIAGHVRARVSGSESVKDELQGHAAAGAVLVHCRAGNGRKNQEDVDLEETEETCELVQHSEESSTETSEAKAVK